LAVSALQRAYFTVSPTGAGEYQMNVDALKTQTLRCSRIDLSSATLSSDDANALLSIAIPYSNGKIQFGSGETPWATLHSNVFQLHGDIVCQRLYTANDAVPTPTVPSALPLDAQGKIPWEYLPEVYQTSLIHNHVGVGIGTTVPQQKLHVEGSGFVRGRLGVNMETPVASLHVSPPVATPGLRIDTGSSSNAFEIYADGDVIVQMHPNGIHFDPPVTMRAFSVPNHLYYKHQRLTVTDPTLIQAPLTVRSLASENAQPLVVDAPRVECPEIRAHEWTYPLTATSATSGTVELPMTFQGAHLSLAEGTFGFNDAAWVEAYRSGDELAQLLMRDETTLPMSRLVAYLWDTVQTLRARVNALEQKS
jgi:hypothetical protein